MEQGRLPCGSTETSAGNCQEMETCILGTSHTIRKQSFRAPWRVSEAEVSRGNAGWTASKSGHVSHARSASDGLLQDRLEESAELSVMSPIPPTPDNPIDQGAELN